MSVLCVFLGFPISPGLWAETALYEDAERLHFASKTYCGGSRYRYEVKCKMAFSCDGAQDVVFPNCFRVVQFMFGKWGGHFIVALLGIA